MILIENLVDWAGADNTWAIVDGYNIYLYGIRDSNEKWHGGALNPDF